MGGEQPGPIQLLASSSRSSRASVLLPARPSQGLLFKPQPPAAAKGSSCRVELFPLEINAELCDPYGQQDKSHQLLPRRSSTTTGQCCRLQAAVKALSVLQLVPQLSQVGPRLLLPSPLQPVAARHRPSLCCSEVVPPQSRAHPRAWHTAARVCSPAACPQTRPGQSVLTAELREVQVPLS